MNGNADNDFFVYSALADSGTTALTRDEISSFAAGDRINVQAIDAITGGANEAFQLDTDASFSAGEFGGSSPAGPETACRFPL